MREIFSLKMDIFRSKLSLPPSPSLFCSRSQCVHKSWWYWRNNFFCTVTKNKQRLKIFVWSIGKMTFWCVCTVSENECYREGWWEKEIVVGCRKKIHVPFVVIIIIQFNTRSPFGRRQWAREWVKNIFFSDFRLQWWCLTFFLLQKMSRKLK